MEILKTKIAISGLKLMDLLNSEIKILTYSAKHCIERPKRTNSKQTTVEEQS
ncbi:MULTISPECIES: hypothetical protein [Acinetobacter calcoaceticus/baumannii complex]|uniref:hypothetical protein n=1 Tax=Acinetobacter calcoaceticus/baumannii complex TaxID=909768 RepID=UPI000B338042|nr:MULTISPECIES: hypothetical protein [Acinetobacter calcoaceticus/baumannii complex]MCG9494466.1 hypothetical protein [Acinetobacter pittii]MCU4349380.1 hypothetical protein [Acinetobacter lactucae]QXA08996.1 hypothetical protein I6L27_05485 [Acinetobacter pittii]